ncbi:MAG: ribosome-associated translation inhibitor RaiA [Oligoflexales bacterium]|nr:ribosome-associated translation inhibitor RaiA [Oligoflexales bacterium]
MEFQFTFKQMDSSQSMINYSQQKIEDVVNKYMAHPIKVHMRFSSVQDRHYVSCHVTGSEGFNYLVHNLGESMYSCIDRLVDKLESRLRRHKDKLRSHGAKQAIKGFKLHDLSEFRQSLLKYQGSKHPQASSAVI